MLLKVETLNNRDSWHNAHSKEYINILNPAVFNDFLHFLKYCTIAQTCFHGNVFLKNWNGHTRKWLILCFCRDDWSIDILDKMVIEEKVWQSSRRD